MNKILLRSLALAVALTAGFLGSANGVTSTGSCNVLCRNGSSGPGSIFRYSFDATYSGCCQSTADCPPGYTGNPVSWVGGNPPSKQPC